MGHIDAHVHVWTQDFDRYPIAPEYTPADMKPPTFTPEELFSHCKPSGVDRIVLIQMSYYGFDNSYMLDTMAKWPEAFGGVAIIDHTQAGVADEMAAVREQGVRGFRVQPDAADPATWLEDDAYQRMMGVAGELGMAICALIDPEYLAAVGRAAQAFPATNFVVDHLSRTGALGPIEQAHVDAMCALAPNPNCSVKVSAFYALGEKTPPHHGLIPMIRQVYEALGPDRLMWASDCPFQVDNETYEDSISLVRDGLDFLSDCDKEAMLTRTAERVYFGD